MECLIGIKGRDFVLMATDCVAGRSIIAMKKGVVIVFYSACHTTHRPHRPVYTARTGC